MLHHSSHAVSFLFLIIYFFETSFKSKYILINKFPFQLNNLLHTQVFIHI